MKETSTAQQQYESWWSPQDGRKKLRQPGPRNICLTLFPAKQVQVGGSLLGSARVEDAKLWIVVFFLV